VRPHNCFTRVSPRHIPLPITLFLPARAESNVYLRNHSSFVIRASAPPYIAVVSAREAVLVCRTAATWQPYGSGL